MSTKTPADLATSNYCSKHGFHENNICPECLWDEDQFYLEIGIIGGR